MAYNRFVFGKVFHYLSPMTPIFLLLDNFKTEKLACGSWSNFPYCRMSSKTHTFNDFVIFQELPAFILVIISNSWYRTHNTGSIPHSRMCILWIVSTAFLSGPEHVFNEIKIMLWNLSLGMAMTRNIRVNSKMCLPLMLHLVPILFSNASKHIETLALI